MKCYAVCTMNGFHAKKKEKKTPKQQNTKSRKACERHSGSLSCIRPLSKVYVVAICVLTVCVHQLTLHYT